jgi:ABC-type sulfate/molybdate transport systems ATPase subunit
VLDVDIEVDRREFTVAARFRAGPGERLALFGMSGAGKTTVLEAIAGLVSPRRGHVVVAGRTLTSSEPPVAVPVWRRRVGLLRQDPALFPHLSVRENLLYAPGAGSRGAELADLAGRLGLDGLLDARPAALSGGQAHRAALARLLLAHCDTLLLDEPYTGLDAASGRQLTMVLRELVAARGIPAVLVAHELAEAQAFADRIVVIDRGRIIQVAAPHEIVLHPAVRRVAELVGYRGFVPVTPEGSLAEDRVAEDRVAEDRVAEGSVAEDGEAGRGGAVAGVHPGRVQPGAHPGLGVVLRGTVRAWRPLGAGWEADIEVGGAAVGGHFAEQVAAEGESLTFTAVGAPIFGADGRLLAHSEEVRA